MTSGYSIDHKNRSLRALTGPSRCSSTMARALQHRLEATIGALSAIFLVGGVTVFREPRARTVAAAGPARDAGFLGLLRPYLSAFAHSISAATSRTLPSRPYGEPPGRVRHQAVS